MHSSKETPLISLTEELVLLAIEDDGKIAYTAGSPGFAMALIGACLVELNILGRIDADLDAVNVLSTEPTGIETLDAILKQLGAGPKRPVRTWSRELQPICNELVKLSLRSLLQRGVLQQTEARFLWALRSRRYPMIDGKEQKEAKLRIISMLLSTELPTPHDTVLIGLAVAGGLLESFLTRAQIAQLADRWTRSRCAGRGSRDSRRRGTARTSHDDVSSLNIGLLLGFAFRSYCMNTTIETLDSATIVKATGRLDFEASASFQKELEQAIANAAARKAAVAINCEGIEYVSSAGLRVFLVAARAAKSAAIGFGVCSLTAGVKEVFDISGFGRIIDVFPDQAAALAKFSTPA